MTTSRAFGLFILLAGLVGALQAQAPSQPKDLPWAIAALAGEGDWAVRLPQLLVRDWARLPEHLLTEPERDALRAKVLADAVRGFDQQIGRLKLDLDKKRLMGTLPATEPAATLKSIADLTVKREAAVSGRSPDAEAPKSLPFRAVWSAGGESLPWKPGPRADLLERTKALYLVSGTLRVIGDYLSVKLELYSAIEDRSLAEWQGQFAVEEAPLRIAEASDHFRASLFGRPWAGIVLTSTVPGAKVRVNGIWHTLPWANDDLEPGTLDLAIQNPGRADETRSVILEASVRAVVALDAQEEAANPLVLETVPPGIPLYVDSRYLGLSPQTVDRPLAISRVRAQSPGWATAAWEIGPDTVSPWVETLHPPVDLPSVPAAKDRFYDTLAAFSFSLTSTAFVGAWKDEQIKLTNAYAASGSALGYENAKNKFTLVSAAYAGCVVLTSGVFVWMMLKLGEYLGASQASLP